MDDTILDSHWWPCG